MNIKSIRTVSERYESRQAATRQIKRFSPITSIHTRTIQKTRHLLQSNGFKLFILSVFRNLARADLQLSVNPDKSTIYTTTTVLAIIYKTTFIDITFLYV